MRYAVLADIHSNLEALEAVLSEIDKRNVDELLCLGDIVGYGADPAECVRIVRRDFAAAVCGNHDRAIFDDKILESFRPDAENALLWTRDILTEEDKAFLDGLQLKESKGGFLLVHAAPLFPEEWGYVLKISDARRNFLGFDEPLCFLGHSHAPAVFAMNEKEGLCSIPSEPVVFLSPVLKYIINPGSVGQPRDKNPKASFAIYDSKRREAEIIRVPYAVKTASNKIRRAGLAPNLGERLELGE